MTEFIRLPDFDIETTLLGGQAFRWEKEVAEEVTSFSGIVNGQIIQVESNQKHQNKIRLSAACNLKKEISEYFDLQRDYATAIGTLSRDTELTLFIGSLFGPDRYPRILRQPWFETLIGFIVSANNNLPRIRKTIKVISRTYGERVKSEFGSGFAFPTPAALSLADPVILREDCKTGYRDAYIIETSKAVSGRFSFWDNHPERSTDELREALLDLPGVGPKVAECVLLFGFHRWEAFPVDTWIRQAVKSAFPKTAAYSDRDIASFARERFGSNSGFAQQLLFEAARKRLSPSIQPGGQPFQAGL